METKGARASTAVADGPLLASGRRLGERYRLERPLGHGGMAAVWLATDERLDRQVAVKVLSDTLAHDDEYLDRFQREAHVAAGLQHPHLVSIYDFDAGDRPFLVMEYIPGGDLAQRVEAGDVPDAESLARELLSALRHIHAAGVLHRDIKPQNVLIDAAGHARLTDFGIAQPRDATALTKTGHVIGTEAYLAPEVKQGAPASEQADLFALGVVLADASREGAAAGLWELTDRLRDPDPDLRPHSAAAALATLERRKGPA
ncbi:MAG: serine/threonine-protein kinase, partial [Solirubrobacterales bacterium]